MRISQVQDIIPKPPNSGPGGVSIVIPVCNKADLTRLCLEYVKLYTTGVFEVIVVDNASTDHTSSILKDFKDFVTVINNTDNASFSQACNQGAAMAKHGHIVFLNNDTVPKSGWLKGLLDPFFKDPLIGITGSRLLYPNGKIQHAGVVFTSNGFPYHIYEGCDQSAVWVNKPRRFGMVTGACLCIEKALFNSVGGFDEGYINGLEDADLCLKVRETGRHIYYNPLSSLIHFGSMSDNRQAAMEQNKTLYKQRWQGKALQDDLIYLKEDKTNVRINIEKGNYEYLNENEFLSEAAVYENAAKKYLQEGDKLRALIEYAKMNNRYPYYVPALIATRDLSIQLNSEASLTMVLSRLKNMQRLGIIDV